VTAPAVAARPTVSVIVPVKNGGALLEEVLAAIIAQRPEELLVVDSGSTDGSVEVARRHGATLIEIDPASFKHGPTRNLAAEAATGEVLAFLTQDATPVPGWLEAIRADFAGDPALGAVFGPHLARADTSPMIARELERHFGGFAGEGGTAKRFGPGDETFLSNVNAAYRRACWAELRFADLAYSEDQAFGRTLAAHGHWHKLYDPAVAVLHAHDYPPREFFKRYFDEYRGLAETVHHREEIHPVSIVTDSLAMARADARLVRHSGGNLRAQARWAGRSVRHHAGRRVAAVLGSRAADLPDAIERRLSLEGRTSSPQPQEAGGHQPVATVAVPPSHGGPYEAIARLAREGAAPLTGDAARRVERDSLHVAFVIPSFRVGSGGHMTIFRLVEQLESRGHTCTIWIDDPLNYNAEGAAVLRGTIIESFRPIAAPVFKGFENWFGADVVVATGWQTVYPTLLLPDCAARAYLVQDNEPDFYAASAEREFAEATYGFGLHGIAASPWLAQQVQDRGGSCGIFDLAADHAEYYPRALERAGNAIAFYARMETPRRGVAIGALALEQVVRERPGTRIISFGTATPAVVGVPTESAGVLTADGLARLYSEATIGLCLSLTNYSLIPGEMLACGLPCVDVDHPSAVGVFGQDGPVAFAQLDVGSIAGRVIALLDDAEDRARRSQLGIEFVGKRTWAKAGLQVEAELRRALQLAGE
jgi:glycosyltransferase involved in cell wall biosynthesis